MAKSSYHKRTMKKKAREDLEKLDLIVIRSLWSRWWKYFCS